MKRYLVVGGAGTLEGAPGVRLICAPDFPEAYRPEAEAGAAFLDLLRQQQDPDWTFLSPSLVFAPREPTGVFRLGTDQLIANGAGSSISFDDFAIALIDELETPAHVRQRFIVGYEGGFPGEPSGPERNLSAGPRGDQSTPRQCRRTGVAAPDVGAGSLMSRLAQCGWDGGCAKRLPEPE